MHLSVYVLRVRMCMCIAGVGGVISPKKTESMTILSNDWVVIRARAWKPKGLGLGLGLGLELGLELELGFRVRELALRG